MENENQDVVDDKEGPERELDWDEYVRRREAHKKAVHLEGKDYLALFIAALQTIFLPLIIVALVTVAAAILLVFLIL
ncbi:MAG: hypothetical protein KGY80_10970 [Candidatus Thorarchaeota archaeon]|nr:hypothetical protein [Candidatus Thorarchaeota archaeon]